MKIEKRKPAKRDVPADTFTPEQAKMVLVGLTDCVTTSATDMFVHLNDYGELVIPAVKTGRTSRYPRHEIYAARDCCIIVNGTGHVTSECYLKPQDELYLILKSIRPDGGKFIELRDCLQEHLSNMRFELHIVSGGYGLSKMDDYDTYAFGQIKDVDDEETVPLSV